MAGCRWRSPEVTLAESSFDIVSSVDLQEVKNAIAQAMKEIVTRFDLKGTGSDDRAPGRGDPPRLRRRVQAEGRARRARGAAGEAQRAPEGAHLRRRSRRRSGRTVRQKVTLQKGIPTDKAREIVKVIKETKLKVQAAIQGDQVRVSGKNKDDLQSVMQAPEGDRPRHRHAVHQLQVEPLALAGSRWAAGSVAGPQGDRRPRRGRPRPGRGALRGAGAAPTCAWWARSARYIREGGGKRIRPALLLLACRLVRLPGRPRRSCWPRWWSSSTPRPCCTTTSSTRPRCAAAAAA